MQTRHAFFQVVYYNDKMHRPNPVLVRYLLVLFLFSVLLLVFFIPVYFYIYNFTLNNEISYIQDRQHMGVASLDTALNTINNAAVHIAGDSRFRIFNEDSYKLARSSVLLNELRSQFNGYFISHFVIADAGIVFSKNTILTRREIFYLPEIFIFYGNYIQCGKMSADEWFSLIENTNYFSPVMQYTSMSNNLYDGITYSVQWKNRENFSPNILYAILPVKNIMSLLADDELLSKSSVRIYNDKNETLYSYSGDKWNPDEKYHILTEKSNVTLTNFSLLVPESVISSKMDPIKRLMLYFALSAVFFALCLSLIFAYKWTEPIRGLLQKIDSTRLFKNEYEKYTGSTAPWRKNSFRRFYGGMAESINSLDYRLENSLRTIESQAILLREQIFNKALNQGLYSKTDRQLFDSVFDEIPEYFQLALINYGQSEDLTIEQTTAFQLQLINSVKTLIGNIFIHSVGDNSVILLLPLHAENEFWYNKLRDLRKILKQQFEKPLNFSLSSIYMQLNDLPRAWQELQSISLISDIKNTADIGRISDIANFEKQIPLDITAIQIIYNALNNGNDEAACNILSEITSKMIHEKDMVFLGLAAGIIHNILVLLKNKNPAVLVSLEIPLYISGREEDLLTRQFPECFRMIGKLIQQKKEENNSQLGSLVLEYINENLYNRDLYSIMVQDHFDISNTTLQKLIKEAVGQTFQSYVENRRLSKANELLAEGMLTVTQVAMKCGFTSKNSFFKAFKRIYGCPPGAVRSKHSHP